MRIKQIVKITLLALFLISLGSGLGDTYASQHILNTKGKSYLELIGVAKTLQPDDKLLVWIDINSTVDRLGFHYLPADPTLFGIKWIIISFAPDISESGLFWCLTEIEVHSVEDLIKIPWVFDIMLIKIGVLNNQKTTSQKLSVGFQEAMERASQYNGTLEVIVQMENSTRAFGKIDDNVQGVTNEIVQNVTATMEQAGGRLRKNYYEGSFTLSVTLPAQSTVQVTANPFIKKLYLDGPIIPEGLDHKLHFYSFGESRGLYLLGTIILLCPTAFAININRKIKKKMLGLFVAVIIALSLTVGLQIMPTHALYISTAAIRAWDVWSIGNAGKGVNIAVIDTGFDINNNDIAPAIVHRINIDDSSNNVGGNENHGTHTAGIIAGRGANNIFLRGVAWEAGLVLIKIVTDDDFARAVDWVIDNRAQYNITVINFSGALSNVPLGGDGLESPGSIIVDDAVENGIVAVISAGNEGNNGYNTITSPGNAFNAITVGAVDDKNTVDVGDDELAEFPYAPYPWGSGRGPTGDGRPKPDVVAPGVNIMSPENGTQSYTNFTGTSAAAPHVAGTVALMLNANTNLTPTQVKAILRQTANLTNAKLSGQTVNDRGYGIIDAYSAVQLAQNVNGIQRHLMYDSWNVQTDVRDLGGGYHDYATFTIDAPSSTFGISVTNVRYYYGTPTGIGNIDYELINRVSAQHVWIDNVYYHLGIDMNKYLFSGPRISEKRSGYAMVRAFYKVNNVMVEYGWEMHVDVMWLRLIYNGSSSQKTLTYIDIDAWDATNFPRLPSTNETIYYERKLGNDVLYVRDVGHSEYIQIYPLPNNPTIWVLRSGYTDNNPDMALNEEYTYDRDITIYYQGADASGPWIWRKTNNLPAPNLPPSTPTTPLGQNSGHTYSTYSYSTNSTDPQGDSIHYEFDWGDGSRTWTDWYPSGTSASASHSWTTAGTKYVRVRAQDSNNAWSDWSASLTVIISVPSPPGGGGGCPYVSSWNGDRYILDNNILPRAEMSNGADVEDYYKLEQTLVSRKRKYKLLVSEFEFEHSYIDQVKLLAIDHKSDVNIAVTSKGEILTYKNPSSPTSAVDNNGNDRLNEIRLMDGNVSDPNTYFQGTLGDFLTLNFGQVSSDNAKLILRDDQKKADDQCILVQLKDGNGIWQTVEVLVPHTYWSIEAVNLAPYVVQGQDLCVRLYWQQPHRLDYVGLDTTRQAHYELLTATLVSAIHSDQGDVKALLTQSDNQYADLIPGQQIELEFSLPNNSQEARTYIFNSEGHYYTMP